MADYKLDIFKDVLPAINQHDYGFLARQDAEAQKGFHAPVVLRWASALKRPADAADYMLMLVNARANLDFFTIADHPELQWGLLASCGLNMPVSHEWINMPARARPTSALHAFIGQHWPEANEEEINLLIRGFTRDSFTEFLHRCGLSPTDEKAALEAYDRFHGIKVKSSGGKKKAKR